ncbi:hypothetical protein EV361DRAFT_946416 [Lentinula raphanica]|nr:hypothetical protein EV361DRAFT_946416 [Lentinula raphanica]
MRLVAIIILFGLCSLVRSVPMPPARANTIDPATYRDKRLPSIPLDAKPLPGARQPLFNNDRGLRPPPLPKKDLAVPTSGNNNALHLPSDSYPFKSKKALHRTFSSVGQVKARAMLYTYFDHGLPLKSSSVHLDADFDAQRTMRGYLMSDPTVAQFFGVETVEVQFPLSYPYTSAETQKYVRAKVQDVPSSGKCNPFCWVTAIKQEKRGEVVYRGMINQYDATKPKGEEDWPEVGAIIMAVPLTIPTPTPVRSKTTR